MLVVATGIIDMEGKSYEKAIEIDSSQSDDDEVVEARKPSVLTRTRRGLLAPSKRQGAPQLSQTTRKSSTDQLLDDLFGLSSSTDSGTQNSETFAEITNDQEVDPATVASLPKIPERTIAVNASNSRMSDNTAGSKRHFEESTSAQPFIIHLVDSDEDSAQEIQPRTSFVGRSGRRMVSGGRGTREDPLSLDSSEESDDESDEDAFPVDALEDEREKDIEVTESKDGKESIEAKEAKEREECLGALRKRFRPDDEDHHHDNVLSPKNNAHPCTSPDRSLSGKDKRRERLKAMKNGVEKTMTPLRWSPSKSSPSKMATGTNLRLPPKEGRSSRAIQRNDPLSPKPPPLVRVHEKVLPKSQGTSIKITACANVHRDNVGRELSRLDHQSHPTNQQHVAKRQPENPSMSTSSKSIDSEQELTIRLVDTNMPLIQALEDEKKIDEISSSKNENNHSSILFEEEKMASMTVASTTSMEGSFSTDILENDEIDFGDFAILPIQDEHFHLDNQPIFEDKLEEMFVFDDDERGMDLRHQSTEPLDEISNELLQLQNLDDDLPALLSCVEHLSETYFCEKTGLPIRQFTVYSENDGTYPPGAYIPGS